MPSGLLAGEVGANKWAVSSISSRSSRNLTPTLGSSACSTSRAVVTKPAPDPPSRATWPFTPAFRLKLGGSRWASQPAALVLRLRVSGAHQYFFHYEGGHVPLHLHHRMRDPQARSSPLMIARVHRRGIGVHSRSSPSPTGPFIGHHVPPHGPLPTPLLPLRMAPHPQKSVADPGMMAGLRQRPFS